MRALGRAILHPMPVIGRVFEAPWCNIGPRRASMPREWCTIRAPSAFKRTGPGHLPRGQQPLRSGSELFRGLPSEPLTADAGTSWVRPTPTVRGSPGRWRRLRCICRSSLRRICPTSRQICASDPSLRRSCPVSRQIRVSELPRVRSMRLAGRSCTDSRDACACAKRIQTHQDPATSPEGSRSRDRDCHRDCDRASAVRRRVARRGRVRRGGSRGSRRRRGPG